MLSDRCLSLLSACNVGVWPNSWMDQDSTWYDGRSPPRPHCVRWCAAGRPSEKGHSMHPPPSFRPISIVAKRSPISATVELLLPLIQYKCAHCNAVVTVKWTSHCRPTTCILCWVRFRYKGKDIGNRYGPGTGPIVLDNVACVGDETSIAACPVVRPGWYDPRDCDHTRDVSVSCGASPVQYGNCDCVYRS